MIWWVVPSLLGLLRLILACIRCVVTIWHWKRGSDEVRYLLEVVLLGVIALAHVAVLLILFAYLVWLLPLVPPERCSYEYRHQLEEMKILLALLYIPSATLDPDVVPILTSLAVDVADPRVLLTMARSWV